MPVIACPPLPAAMTPFPAKSNSALLILGHGSTEHPRSSSAVRQHAEALRKRQLFAEVHTGFWKEEPHFDAALAQCQRSEEVYVVPAFISEGYFTRQVIPRELGLQGPTTVINGRRVHYCQPVGSHASMTDRLLDRADALATGIDRSQISLIIVGHGTPRDRHSASAIRRQVEKLRAGDTGFAEVTDAYLSQAPFIGEWDQLTRADHVVVVPFFIADGLHSEVDIPVELGLEPGPAKRGASRVRERTVYYAGAIGSDAGIADVILEQVKAFDTDTAANTCGSDAPT